MAMFNLNQLMDISQNTQRLLEERSSFEIQPSSTKMKKSGIYPSLGFSHAYHTSIGVVTVFKERSKSIRRSTMMEYAQEDDLLWGIQ